MLQSVLFVFAADKMSKQKGKLKEMQSAGQKSKIYERMGDLSADISLFKTAIRYYQKMVRVVSFTTVFVLVKITKKVIH